MANSVKCPCGSGTGYDSCCGMYITGRSQPPTPEALMRARYTAYTKADIDYIAGTVGGKAGQVFNEDAAKDWAANSEWLGLVIIKADAVTDNDTVGNVDFLVRYKEKNTVVTYHEISEFHKVDGTWLYMDGVVNPKIGRNDQCFCGSGKKYKKCHGKND